jgi:hypothetical protein
LPLLLSVIKPAGVDGVLYDTDTLAATLRRWQKGRTHQ